VSDSIGRGIIELVADARGVRAGVEDAKRAIQTLGDTQAGTSVKAARSIEDYIAKLKLQADTVSKTTRETELYKLALRGASDAQIAAADSSLRIVEAHDKAYAAGQLLRTTMISIATAALAAGAAVLYAANNLINSAGNYQDLSEKVGASASSLSQLSVSAAVGGVSMDAVGGMAIKLSKNLVGVDDESKAAGAAVAALGLNIDKLRAAAPTERIQMLAEAMDKFADSSAKGDVAVALFGKAGAESLPFLKELASGLSANAGLTEQQIKLADDYADAQKRLRAEWTLIGQRLVTDLLPAYNQLKNDLVGLTEGGDIQTVVVKTLRAAWDSFVSGLKASLAFVAETRREIDLLSTAATVLVTRLKALGSGDIKLFSQLGDDARVTFEGIQSKYDTMVARIRSAGTISAAGSSFKPGGGQFSDVVGGTGQAAVPKPALVYSGPTKSERAGPKGNAESLAEQLAKATLANELAQIKITGDAIKDEYANRERVLEAMHAAGIVREADYYNQKRDLISANLDYEEVASKQQIARLQAEKFTGDKAAIHEIENKTKIAEATAKLAKLRADAARALEVVDINQGTSLKNIAKATDEAAIADEKYIASLVRRNAIEQQGVGKGDLARSTAAGQQSIDEKFQQTLEKAERDHRNTQNALFDPQRYEDYLARVKAVYEKETAIYQKRTKDMLASSADWKNGMDDALNNYIDKARDVASQSKTFFENAFKSMEDALVQFITKGKLDFKSFATTIITELIRIQVRATLAAAAASFQKSDSGSLLSSLGSIIGSFFGGSSGGAASGAPTDAGITGMTGFAAEGGSIPANSTYLVGEKGPEILRIGSSPGVITPNNVAFGGKGGDTFNVDLRGASMDAVQRLEQFVNSINGSIERRAFIVMEQAKIRGAAA
jgi:lambda family phage tail tape measure protein